MTNVAIILRAGRQNYINVVRDLSRSIDYHGHSQHHRITLYLSFDANHPLLICHLDNSVPDCFSEIRCITEEVRQKTVSRLTSSGLLAQETGAAIFLQKPYSYQLNSALFSAMEAGEDVALLFDDDQALVVPVESESGGLRWVDQDVIGWHLRCLAGNASLSVGSITGWRSPIPRQVLARIPLFQRRRLGELLDGGTEVISRDSFLSPQPSVLFENAMGNNQCVPLREHLGYRWICPANMGINLHDPFPAFFNPAGARGEDAFFSMCIAQSATVMQIPAAIFHDPFLRYPGIYEGRFPTDLTAEGACAEEVKRFAEAILGWIKYMPLFLYAQLQGDAQAYEREIRSRVDLAETLGPTLSHYLECKYLEEMKDTLVQYHQQVAQDYETWMRVDDAWRHKIQLWGCGQAG